MKRVLFRFFWVALLITVLGGCATYHKRNFNAYPEVKTIGVLEPGFEKHHTKKKVQVDSDLRFLLGGLGLGWYMADMESKSNKFRMTARDFKIASELQDALSAELQNVGYAVKELKAHRTKAGFFKKYNSLENADAYLDLIFSYAGYARTTSLSSTLYHPRLWCRVRLINKSNDVLYDYNISYGDIFIRAWGTSMPADKQYSFKTSYELMNDPDRAIEGLRTGLSLIAKRIAQDLSVKESGTK